MESGMKCPRCGYVARFGRKQREQVRESYTKAFTPWSAEDDQRLAKLAFEGASVVELTQALQRQPGAIRRRMELLQISLKQTTDQPPAVAWEEQESAELQHLTDSKSDESVSS